MIARKVLISGISLILVVGVAIGVVAVVIRSSLNKSGHESLSSQMKLVTRMCNYTDHQTECQQSLSPVAQNSSAGFKDYMKAALLSISDQAQNAFNMTESLLVEAKNGTRVKRSIEECKDLMKEARGELQNLVSYVDDAELQTMKDRALEIRIWVGSVTSYAGTCMDVIGDDDPKVSEAMRGPIDNVTAITDNALAIMGEISNIVSMFGVKLNENTITEKGSNNRRLMGETIEEDVPRNGHPSWMSRVDRKLMAKQDNGRIKANVVVAQDGSGQFRTINEALRAYPKGNQGRFVIYVKKGVYKETVIINKTMINIYMYGDGPRATIVTGNKGEETTGDKISTSGTFQVYASGFIGRSMGFTNTAGPEARPAVALRTSGDMIGIYNCRISGYQDTLYMNIGRQFFRNCVISGHVDYIFGDARVVIQNSLIIVRKSSLKHQNQAFITAPGQQTAHECGGTVLHNCRIVPEEALFPTRFEVRTYLGRPWKTHAKAAFIECTIADVIRPEGVIAWDGKDFNTQHSFFGEFKNRGPGANLANRVKWPKGGFTGEMDRNTAAKFTVDSMLLPDTWLKMATIPYLPSFAQAL
ncbi:pectinesterase-like [Argentina anserina]|uniref:pectinesterase-like n=1 Tax=Argentina anserina TaxID=57926 RepID=UPI00217634BC|nr:pectinesterase-like [Potentilla anserina]